MRSSGVTNDLLCFWGLVAPVEVARPSRPKRFVQCGALYVLGGLLARPRQPLGTELSCRLTVHRLLDACLLLALEEGVVLELITVEIAVERHLGVEIRVAALQLQMLANRLRERGLRLHGRGIFS